MDIQFFGANCVALTAPGSKGTRVVVDDNLAELGAKSVTRPGDIALYTTPDHSEANAQAKLVIDHAGEYEVSDISIYGIPARAHTDAGDGAAEGRSTMYKIISGELSIFVPGHVYPDLSDSQLEAIGMVDVIVVPVGGNGYTLDPVGALKIIKAIEPKLVIPTHYDDSAGGRGRALKYEVPQQTLEQALTGLSMEPKETVQKLKLKPSDLPDVTQLIVLERA